MHKLTHNNSHKVRTQWLTNIIIIKQSSHIKIHLSKTYIYTNKKSQNETKKNYMHIMTESVKDKYVTHNKNGKAKSNHTN